MDPNAHPHRHSQPYAYPNNQAEKPKTREQLAAEGLNVLAKQIEETKDEWEKKQLQDEFNTKDKELHSMAIEKSMTRRSCWVCLMEASVTKLVKVCDCSGPLEFAHLSCIQRYQTENEGTDWGKFCLYCSSKYNAVVPTWVQNEQIRILELQNPVKKV